MIAALRKRLLLECPVIHRSLSADPLCDFEYFDGGHYLKLWASNPSDYGEVRDYGSESNPVIWTLGQPIAPIRSYRRAIEFNDTDERKWRLDVVRSISQGTLIPGRAQRRSVTLIDFALAEPEDEASARIAGVEASTVRIGILSQPKANGGAIGLGFDSFIKGGFKFRFDELKVRTE